MPPTLRTLSKTPLFTTIAILSLALGIGAATSVFSLINAILLRSLPVPNPHALRLIRWSGADFKPWYQGGRAGQSRDPEEDPSGRAQGDSVSFAIFRSLREQCAAQAEIFAYSRMPVVIARTRREVEAVAVQGLLISDNFFTGLGLRPQLGRLLDSVDERAATAPAIVISHHWWESQFNLDPAILGQPIALNGQTFTIVGVLTREFHGVRPGEEIEFYAPLSSYPQLNHYLSNRGGDGRDPWVVPLMARLKPGVTDAQFQTALNVIFPRETGTAMKEPKVWTTEGRAGPDDDRILYRTPLRLLLAVTGIVLLVACANLSGLLLARGVDRQHDFAIRAALGAGRGRLVWQSLAESLVISLIGGSLGIVIALWGRSVLFHLLGGPVSEGISQSGLRYDLSLDLRVLGFTLAVAITAALLSGLWPALRAASVTPLAGLGRRSTPDKPRLRAVRGIIVAQIALSVLIVGCAGLFVRSLLNLTRIDTGYAMDHLLVFDLRPGGLSYVPSQSLEFYDRVLKSLVEIPGVRSAALDAVPLLAGMLPDKGFEIPGDAAAPKTHATARITCVNETFFQTMGIPILLGRELRTADTAGAPRVAVVNETFVRKYLPGRNPIGLAMNWTGGTNLQIVGVCRDANYTNLRAEVLPIVHLSIRQITTGGAAFLVRTAPPPLSLAPAVRRAISAADPGIPVFNLGTQERVRDMTIGKERLFAALCGSLAVLAMLISCLGLYGLMACQVARRTGEIGIRIALGATRRHIAIPILREAFLLSASGIAVGLPLTLALTRVLRSHLYGVEPSDPATYLFAALTFIATALTAAWLPARRAANIDPMRALKTE